MGTIIQMNTIKKNPNQYINPRNFGWIHHKMSEACINHIWDCINTAKGDNAKGNLVGQIDRSIVLEDKNGWLWNNVLKHLYLDYDSKWGHGHCKVPLDEDLDPYLKDMWVNYQKQHEYNPIHDHGGLYSFAAWLNIPTHYEDQAQIGNAKDASSSYNSTFMFQYLDIFGSPQYMRYELSPDYENMLLFFPSCLQHCVFPYYNCDEERISISGNIWLKHKGDNNVKYITTDRQSWQDMK